MSKIIDAHGKPFPEPVVMTVEDLMNTDEMTIIIDNAHAKDNTLKLARSQGCAGSVENKNDGIDINMRKNPGHRTQSALEISCASAGGTVILVGSEVLGRGDNAALGRLLMQSFLSTLASLPERPESLIFMNSGVKLVAEGSPVLGELKRLNEQGTELLACGTCLSRLGLSDKVVAGQASNMLTLADMMLKAFKVISL